MSNDPSWRGDPSVKYALSRRGGLQPWDVMLVNCPNAPCGAQNYFEQGISQSCRVCGTSIADRGDEQYSVGVAIELEIEERRQLLLSEVDDVMGEPFDPGKSTFDTKPPPPGPTRGEAIILMLWILICIAFVAMLSLLSDCHRMNS